MPKENSKIQAHNSKTTCLYTKELSIQEHQPPAQQNDEKNPHQSKGQRLPPFTCYQPPGRKAHMDMCHRPLNNTYACFLKSGFHPTHTVRAGSGAKSHSLAVTFRAGGLPSGENPTFLPIGISETKIHTQDLWRWEQSAGQAALPWVCTQLEPRSPELGPLF